MIYRQLTQQQRYQIHACQGAGWPQIKIANEIGSHASTISRELRRNRGQRGYFSSDQDGGPAMPAIDDEDRPKKKITHEIGQELALLSVKELQERIALLKEEIARLEASIAGKQSSRNVADQFFKK